MAHSVFISHAKEDPLWPPEMVRALGAELEGLGSEVFLDLFHQDRQMVPGKLSEADWREWMNASLRRAERVICLTSPRYKQAAARDMRDQSGYGVAHESSRMISRLYRAKWRNDKWILTLGRDGTDRDDVPDELDDTCPHYRWPSERTEVLEHATGRRREEPSPAGAQRAQPAPAVAGSPPAAQRQRARAATVVTLGLAAAGLIAALVPNFSRPPVQASPTADLKPRIAVAPVEQPPPAPAAVASAALQAEAPVEKPRAPTALPTGRAGPSHAKVAMGATKPVSVPSSTECQRLTGLYAEGKLSDPELPLLKKACTQ